MAGPKIFFALAWSAALVLCSSTAHAVNFKASDVEVSDWRSALFFADLDGDRLSDIVVVDGLKLSIFFQDPKTGFTRTPQQHFQLAAPALVSSAALGKTAESLLVMTSEGV